MVAAMVEMEVKAPTPPPGLGLGDHTIGGILYVNCKLYFIGQPAQFTPYSTPGNLW